MDDPQKKKKEIVHKVEMHFLPSDDSVTTDVPGVTSTSAALLHTCTISIHHGKVAKMPGVRDHVPRGVQRGDATGPDTPRARARRVQRQTAAGRSARGSPERACRADATLLLCGVWGRRNGSDRHAIYCSFAR